MRSSDGYSDKKDLWGESICDLNNYSEIMQRTINSNINGYEGAIFLSRPDTIRYMDQYETYSWLPDSNEIERSNERIDSILMNIGITQILCTAPNTVRKYDKVELSKYMRQYIGLNINGTKVLEIIGLKENSQCNLWRRSRYLGAISTISNDKVWVCRVNDDKTKFIQCSMGF